MDYWSKSLEEVFKELNSSRDGLTGEEANTRLKQYGLNDIPKGRKNLH
jgi:magnesium-transporting ATPase (P-type)